jgi:hypothetical protein
MRPLPLRHVLIPPSWIGAVRAALYVHVRDLRRRIDLDLDDRRTRHVTR